MSSINAIGPKELSVSSSRNMTNNLAGQVPGLIAVQRSGEPGYDLSLIHIFVNKKMNEEYIDNVKHLIEQKDADKVK